MMESHTVQVLLFLCIVSACSDSATLTGKDKSNMCTSDYYGYNCRHHCHCTNRSHCDVTAKCKGACADGWSGPTCQSQNIAFGRPTAIRSANDGKTSRSAVDGNVSTCVTSDSDSRGWLRVDLQMTNVVYYLSIVTNDISPRGWLVYVTEFADYSDIYWATPCATVRSGAQHVLMSCDTPTRGQYLTVLNPDGAVIVCEVQVHLCAAYTFGPLCGMTCNCADVSEVCHPLTGHCRTGCRAGVTGRDCQQPCNMTYGNNCVTPCGRCWRDAECDRVSGECPGECQLGWVGPNCNISCSSSLYGKGCTERCGRCLDNATCAPDTGYCPGMCQAGFTGRRCDQACQDAWYGPGCVFQCGHCLPGSTCNAVTGICRRGCDAGWEGLFCSQKCLPKNFGLNCRRHCPQCLTSCDSITGVCDDTGCPAGRSGPMCDEVCKIGFFGHNCNRTCGACATKSCDVISGRCPGLTDIVCKDGWEGSACDQPCSFKRYGTNCSEECGSCKGGVTCDHVTGDCPSGGCEDGFHDDRCQTRTVKLAVNSKISEALVVSLLTIVLLVVAIVCACLVLKWRRDKNMFRLVFNRSPLAA